MKRISAAFRRYNANSRDTNSSDCVKRALCVAYRLDYDEVSNELNRIKRNLDYSCFNIPPVFNAFIRNHGCISQGTNSDFGLPSMTTVDDFCKAYPEGTFILLVRRPGSNRSTHMVCIVDGDYWDSWDCSKWEIDNIYQISRSISSKQVDFSINDALPEIEEFIQTCLDRYHKKMPWAIFNLSDFYHSDKYTVKQSLSCSFDESVIADLGYCRWYEPSYTYTIKLNPRQSLDTNLATIKEKLRVRLREWTYSVRKEIEDERTLKHTDINKEFRGTTSLLMKLPEWCRSLVTDIRDYGESAKDCYDRIQMDMEALPEDPRYGSDPIVSFYASSFPELKRQIQNYKYDFSRVNYDY